MFIQRRILCTEWLIKHDQPLFNNEGSHLKKKTEVCIRYSPYEHEQQIPSILKYYDS